MQTKKNKTDEINLSELFVYLFSKWPWFLLSIALCVGIAWYYYASSPFVYFRTTSVFIKDPAQKTSSAGLDRYDNYINKVNVASEIYRFRTKNLMREVVKRAHADVSYTIADGLRDKELYSAAPVRVTFPEEMQNHYVAFTLKMTDMKTVELSDFAGDEEMPAIQAPIGDTIPIYVGQVVVSPTNFCNETWVGRTIRVTKNPINAMVGYFLSNFGIRQESEEASILSLSMKDCSPIRAEDMLNTLIAVYNEESIRDKNQVAINTANFINERLIIIERELGSVEQSLESYKVSNEIISLESSAGQAVSESTQHSTALIELETQLQYAGYIRDYLTDPTKEVELIPANTGLSNMNIETQINQYNQMKLRRDKLIVDGNDSNPVIQELNSSLRAMKQTIIRAVDNLIANLEAKIKDTSSREHRAQARVRSIPRKERDMLSIERQQKIKESLYLFLLNRREENALTQAMADNNAQIIDDTMGSNSPIEPSRNRILLLGLLIGLALPAIYFLLNLFLDTRVRSKRDIKEAVSVPILGDIPLDKELMKTNTGKALALVEKKEGMIAEAFRILRTNLRYKLHGGVKRSSGEHKSYVITLTSFNENAGKTFIASNLAMSLVNAGRKVVVVDMDIRKGTLSAPYGDRHRGLTNYLADEEFKAEDLIRKDALAEGLDLVAAGVIAPNPAELLMSERLDELFAMLRERYDYIVADNVPIGIIADGTISNRIADLTIFVVRAGRLDKRQLPELEELYQEGKLKNMALVVNGTEAFRRYGSGYGYGYGYGYGTPAKESIINKVKKKITRK
ncbi:MAG: polysaccharide biosynthesis tyrosine autokinase [Rikenellaceae bacterium]|nr:polysaccharide biosynthesis tyrosine autokinase [Rikenellaceae bacterium]